MIDPQHEELVALATLAREVPSRSGRGVAASSLWRWCVKGCKGIRLESVVCGATRFSSREALARFIAATTAAADGTAQVSTTKDREREIAAAISEFGN